MEPLPHSYRIGLTSGPTGYSSLSAPHLPSIAVAPPAQFDGPGDAWSPEHLLLASVASCFVMTFRAVARAAHLAWSDLDVRAEGTVSKDAGVTRFTDIALNVELTAAAGTEHARATEILAKAESRCLISASLITPVRLNASVIGPDGGQAQRADMEQAGRVVSEVG